MRRGGRGHVIMPMTIVLLAGVAVLWYVPVSARAWVVPVVLTSIVAAAEWLVVRELRDIKRMTNETKHLIRETLRRLE